MCFLGYVDPKIIKKIVKKDSFRCDLNSISAKTATLVLIRMSRYLRLDMFILSCLCLWAIVTFSFMSLCLIEHSNSSSDTDVLLTPSSLVCLNLLYQWIPQKWCLHRAHQKVPALVRFGGARILEQPCLFSLNLPTFRHVYNFIRPLYWIHVPKNNGVDLTDILAFFSSLTIIHRCANKWSASVCACVPRTQIVDKLKK